MDTSKLSTAGIVDITADLGEDNVENRIYRTASGRTVKVKVREIRPSPFGWRVFHISASDCGPDGKALPADAGLRIAPLRALTHHAGPDAPALAEWLEEQCLREAAFLELCVANEYADAGRTGVITPDEVSNGTA
ncbi:hypothetical protein [Phenylobacterium sp.]|uniref:hypothetical protein n=1 Tax=Phenylobacterium sp. TaxID=1871053 RepID=UPI00394248D7